MARVGLGRIEGGEGGGHPIRPLPQFFPFPVLNAAGLAVAQALWLNTTGPIRAGSLGKETVVCKPRLVWYV